MLLHRLKVFVITALVTFSYVLLATTHDKSARFIDLSATDHKLAPSFTRKSPSKKFFPQAELPGKHNYIIRLNDSPVASYRGDVPGFRATAPGYAQDFTKRNKVSNGTNSFKSRSNLKLDMDSSAVKSYQDYLSSKQTDFLVKSAQAIGESLTPAVQLNVAFNGMVVELTQAQAQKLAAMPEVAFVEREQFIPLDTDRGPELIGAPDIWDGTATGSSHFGEGVVVGIIDSGINSDHPSFAETAADGYVHSNPLGDGVYIGDCANGFPEMCNNKLIGVRSYSSITDIYQDSDVFGDDPPPANGEDYDGHGTHVAGTAAGNLLFNVPLLSSPLDIVESDGYRTSSFEFPQISGVAHRANIIAYQVCRPGASGDTYTGCSNAVMLQAIDDAITDGVDVLNMSISGGGNPWDYSIAQAFLAAQEAGIFVAVSAGNNGPDLATTVKNAPWYNSVAASSHGRQINYSSSKTIGSFSGGSTAAPGTISGSGRTLGLANTAIVYAGDFDNPNDQPGDDPAQCLAPFPEGTFSGQIVVCDRGAIARVQKAENVAAGGAGGYVLANLNVSGDGSNLVNDTYVVPGIQISATDGTALKTWLATGSGHTATISTTTASTSIGAFDDIAGFSSRGPNVTVPDIMSPTMTAPGESIYAAYADQQFGHDVTNPTATDFRFLQGTSMSSPHAAGAGALIKSAQPTWSPDNIRSALMMTAERNMTTNNGAGTADIFDMGSGRIRVDLAVKSGLVMDENGANYRAANPDLGGDPKTLNIPSMGNTQCTSTCSWTRTVTATRAATWTLSTTSNNPNVTFSASPASFTLGVGETQDIVVTVTSSNVSTGEQAQGYIELASNNADIPNLHMPAFVTLNTTSIPPLITADIRRDAGSLLLSDVESIEITEFTSRIYGLQKATITPIQLAEDSENSTPFDDTTDGARKIDVAIPAASPLLWVDLQDGTADDFDLYIGRDSNNNGIAEESELVCSSTTSASAEACQVEDVSAGSYWILVHNFSASGATDTVDLRYAYVPQTDEGNFSISAPSAVAAFEPFDIRLFWDDDLSQGDVLVGAFDLATDSNPASAGNLGQSIVIFERLADDVQLTYSNDSPLAGDTVTVTLDVAVNRTAEDIDYTIDAQLPNGLTLDESSISSSDGSVFSVSGGNMVSWSPSRMAYDPSANAYIQSTSIEDAQCRLPNFGQAGGGFIDLAEFDIGFASADGDEVSANYNIPVTFLDTEYSGFSVSDNGIITFGGQPGNDASVHQQVPSAALPNNLIAPLWRDFQLDQASESGIRVGTAEPWIIIQFDNMRHSTFYNGDPSADDTLDFQVLLNNDTGDIYFAYDNIAYNNGDALGGTIGWENANGTAGDYWAYVGGLYEMGLGDRRSFADLVNDQVICYRADTPNSGSLTLTFDVQVDEGIIAQSLTTQLTSLVSSIGGRAETTNYDLDVGGTVTTIEITDPGPLSTAEDTPITLTINYSDNDSVANTIQVSADSGTLGTLSGNNSGATIELTPQANFNGNIAVTVVVTDNEDASETDTQIFDVTVTPVNDAPTVTASSSATTSSGVTTVSLSAQATDVDDSNLTYSWTQTAGPTVTISNPTSANATVSNANATSGTLTFEVSVSDGELTANASTSITVTAASTPTPTPNPGSNSGGGGGGSMNLALLWLFTLLYGWRTLASQKRRKLS